VGGSLHHEPHRGLWRGLFWGFAVWGFISMVGCMVMIAHARTCRTYGEGTDTIEACDD
jgi:hypothetical protein